MIHISRYSEENGDQLNLNYSTYPPNTVQWNRKANTTANNPYLLYYWKRENTTNFKLPVSIKISIKFQQTYFLSSCRKPLQRMGAAQNDCKEKMKAESLLVAKITSKKKKSTLSMQILLKKKKGNHNPTRKCAEPKVVVLGRHHFLRRRQLTEKERYTLEAECWREKDAKALQDKTEPQYWRRSHL